MSPPTLDCETEEARASAARQAADVLRGGGVVIFPTETVYGVGASAAQAAGVKRLREVKGRADTQPFTLHLPNVSSIEQFVDLDDNPALARLARRVLPGPVTFIVDVDDATIERKVAELGLPPEARERLYHGNTIGLRVPDHPAGQAVLAAVGEPVVASSANEAGGNPPKDADQARAALGDQVDLIIDGGPCRYGKASTIVRIDGERAEVLREGVYDKRYIDKLMQRTFVFVCSGNTCRSPMAEAIARDEIARRFSVEPDELESTNIRVLSAGAFAMPGAPMAPEAEQALRKLGVAPQPHRSRPLSPAMLDQAEVVFAMTPSHLDAVRQMTPGAASRTVLLDPSGEAVGDPIGAGVQVYLECAQQMQGFIRRRLDELGLVPPTPHVEKRP